MDLLYDILNLHLRFWMNRWMDEWIAITIMRFFCLSLSFGVVKIIRERLDFASKLDLIGSLKNKNFSVLINIIR